jgi:hypothetical protein
MELNFLCVVINLISLGCGFLQRGCPGLESITVILLLKPVKNFRECSMLIIWSIMGKKEVCHRVMKEESSKTCLGVIY